ncbi:MAG: AAA family ATPase [Bdellovibrionales bacterium]|nr:AAA family ATPase [Bdellovibrionales bacterium]
MKHISSMYKRKLNPSNEQSYFLLGPRGVGKSWFVANKYKKALFFDLLYFDTYSKFLVSPHSLSDYIPSSFRGWVVIDEIQKIPELLNEVHRLIEKRKLKFILTGSSARKLKSKNVNLLAGRALTEYMYPLTAEELKEDFSLKKSLACGHLPMAYQSKNPKKFLNSYIHTYLKEEIQQESLTRSLPNFSRFLSAASFSQGSILNITNIARECSVHRKVVESYFSILRDTLLSYELKPFTKKSKRKTIQSVKFYFFDVGIFQTLYPKGPLDSGREGVALETLVLQEIIAQNNYKNLEYEVFYWRTQNHKYEVDFILYGERGLKAIEVKLSNKVSSQDCQSLLEFIKDYPKTKAFLIYMGKEDYFFKDIHIIPVEKFLKSMKSFV